MKKLLLIAIAMLFSATAFADCTGEELEKAKWLEAQKRNKVKLEQLVTKIVDQKIKIEADIVKVEQGAWPIVEPVKPDEPVVEQPITEGFINP